MTAHAIVYAPIGQGTRSEQVVERLSNAIVAGLLHADEQLPNENELSRLMGVSPVTMREALNTLRARQLIDTRRGRNGGSFVCPVPAQMMHDRHPLRLATPGDLADLGELHCAVVGHSAKLAAQRSTANEHQRLAREIDQFQAAADPQARAQADMRCLLMLATHAQSARLANQELAIQAEWAPLVASIYPHAALHTGIVGAYRRLQAALLAGDEAASSACAQDMIGIQTDHLLEHKLRLDATAPPPQQT
ncbi:FadR/GntR family transcriptional regulator [Achromobacter sp. JUb104]|uniref:FadR/GntR family transcriptional regulator n=1 Tax=Achromobacter sp. JUb104 TaxID=2940590 RepID=UPI000F9276AC|nr:GntR family transcriptional regulator [Achromobacter sp. JUb104]MCS3507413.1 DNA-binding FadR family transcriptional regulator [Achromobacter sp. JUb104]